MKETAVKALARFATLTALTLVLLGSFASDVHSQCMYTTTFCYNFPMGGPYTMFICFKNLTMDENCATMTVTYGGAATTCYYIPGQDRLVAGQPTMGMGPGYCQVVCDCGIMRIDETDGLPVELLDFKVSALDAPRRAFATEPPPQP